MNRQTTLERLLCLLGLSPKEMQPRQGMYEEAIQELGAQVLTGAEEGAAPLNAAVVALTFYHYSITQSGTPESDLTVGGIRVTKSSAGMEAARRL